MRSLLTLVFLVSAFPVSAQAEPEPLNVFNGSIPDVETIYYVALDGDNENAGTEEAPFRTLQHAISQVRRGEAIVVRGGVYYETSTISFQNNGLPDQIITLTAYPGEVPIFDFSQAPQVSNQHGFRINVSFWHVIGLTVRYAGHNGIRMDGSYNILEQMTAYGNDDTGIHMAGTASNNLILNSDSFRNFNQSPRTTRLGNNADGFGAKFGSLGVNNRYYGCRAWENSDDGFDFWEAPNTIVVENSCSFRNGDPEVFGNPPNFEGNGNGFKLGGNYVHTPHVVRRSMAFENFGPGNAKGFDNNNNNGAMTLEHNTAFNNGRNYWFPSNPPAGGGQPYFVNNLDHISTQIPIIPPSAVEAGNSWQQDETITSDDFVSLNTEAASGPRQADGSLPDIGLLQPAPGSFLVDAGVAYGQPFRGSAPDIGAYEVGDGEFVDPWLERGSSALVASLHVYDIEAGTSWELVDDIGLGGDVYGDSDVVLSAVSGETYIDQWIRTAAATSTKNYLRTVAEVTFTNPGILLVAHADAITVKPSWLGDFELTNAQVVINDDGTDHLLTIYRRAVSASETVVLGRNTVDGAENAPMYLAMVGSVTSTSAESPAIAGGFELHQNYPNPFQGETTFSFTLPEPSTVTLSVYDVTGREVAQLAHGMHSAGDHAIRWNGASLSSGVYFIRMTANDVTQTRRIVRVR